MGVLMKALRPLTIVTLGPSVLGLVVAAVAWIAVPSERAVPDVASALLIGAVGGVFVFGSIAAFRLLTERRPDWLACHAWQVSWYMSVLMGLSLGYLIACFRHGIFDSVAAFAIGQLLVGAVVKAALGDAIK